MSKNLYMEKIGKKAKIASKDLSNLNDKKKKFCFKTILYLFKN